MGDSDDITSSRPQYRAATRGIAMILVAAYRDGRRSVPAAALEGSLGLIGSDFDHAARMAQEVVRLHSEFDEERRSRKYAEDLYAGEIDRLGKRIAELVAIISKLRDDMSALADWPWWRFGLRAAIAGLVLLGIDLPLGWKDHVVAELRREELRP
jgi:hypothetical protein